MMLVTRCPLRRNAVQRSAGRHLVVPVRRPGVAVARLRRPARGGVWVGRSGVLSVPLRVDHSIGLGREPTLKILSEELGERRVKVSGSDAPVDDPEAVKDGLVELAFHDRGRGPIEGLAVFAERLFSQSASSRSIRIS